MKLVSSNWIFCIKCALQTVIIGSYRFRGIADLNHSEIGQLLFIGFYLVLIATEHLMSIHFRAVHAKC